MLKKLILRTLLVSLIVVLVVGAINRTIDKTMQTAQNYSQNMEAWLEVQGAVVSAGADAMIIETGDGEQMIVEGQPWSFAQEEGFRAEVGDTVTLTGFYEDDEFKVGSINNNSTGQTVQLRAENGKPGWAGRGEGQGNGRGNDHGDGQGT